MKNLIRNTILAVLVCLVLAGLPASGQSFGQTTPPSTTLSVAVTNAQTSVIVASATNIFAPGLNPANGGISGPTAPNLTYIYVDREVMRVNGVAGTTISVSRGFYGTKAVPHNASAIVWAGPARVFINTDPTGACVTGNNFYLPQISFNTGTFWTCPNVGPNANVWAISGTSNYQNFSDGSFFVDPAPCWFINTTYTGTPAIIVLGASNTPVLNQTTNSTTGTETLTCTINVPTRLTAGKGVTITDITTYYGIQTTAITSVGTATLGSITYPAATATQTASTVTPVAAGGTITNNTVTSGLGITTAGAFWSLKSSLGTPYAVNADRTQLIFAVPFVSTNAGVLTINTPGLQVHYNIDYQ